MHKKDRLFSNDDTMAGKYYWEELLQKITLFVGVICFPGLFLVLYFVLIDYAEKICIQQRQ